MRTTLDLPDTLLDQARALSREKTKRGTIMTALQEYIRMKRLEKLAQSAGAVRMDASFDLSKARHAR